MHSSCIKLILQVSSIQGGILFFNGRLIFHILDVENEPQKTSVLLVYRLILNLIANQLFYIYCTVLFS